LAAFIVFFSVRLVLSTARQRLPSMPTFSYVAITVPLAPIGHSTLFCLGCLQIYELYCSGRRTTMKWWEVWEMEQLIEHIIMQTFQW